MDIKITSGIITLDLHGKNTLQASIMIDDKLRKLNKSVYILRLIHGYNSGTALRDMIWSRYREHPRVKEIRCGGNYGETELILRDIV